MEEIKGIRDRKKFELEFAATSQGREVHMKKLQRRNGFIDAVARETAKMSYPGQMQNIVRKGTRKSVEDWFAESGLVGEVWDDPEGKRRQFRKWHKRCTKQLSRAFRVKKTKHNYKEEAVAAKFLNTFLHQLMKYERCRPLYKKLHLPLDRQVFMALTRRRWATYLPRRVRALVRKQNPYSLSYGEYIQIQDALLGLLRKTQESYVGQTRPKARIELNAIFFGGRA